MNGDYKDCVITAAFDNVDILNGNIYSDTELMSVQVNGCRDSCLTVSKVNFGDTDLVVSCVDISGESTCVTFSFDEMMKFRKLLEDMLKSVKIHGIKAD